MSNWRKLNQLCTRITDGSHFSPIGTSSGYPMLSVKDMRANGFSYDDCKFIGEEDYLYLVKSDCRPLLNDILIAKDGSYLKHVFVIEEERKEVILSSIGILRPNQKLVNPYYIKYFLHSDFVKREVSKKYVSGSALPRIILKNFGEIQVPYIEKNRQDGIVDVLKCLDSKIELNNRINAELEAMAKTLYDYWFVQFDFPYSPPMEGCPQGGVGIGKPYKTNGGKMVWNEELKRDIPEGWEVDNILKIGYLLGGGTPKTGIDSYWDGLIPFYTPSDSTKSFFVLDTEKHISNIGLVSCSSKLYQKGTVFITARGTVGDLNIASRNMAMNQSCYAIAPKTNINYYYLHQCCFDLIQYLKAKANGSIFDSIVSNDIRLTPICIPPLELIQCYGQSMESAYEKALVNMKENQQLSSLRDWLLPMLMNGQITVGDCTTSLDGPKSSDELNLATKASYKIEEEIRMAAEPGGN